MRVAKVAGSVVLLGSLSLGGGLAFAGTTPSTPAGGAVRLFANTWQQRKRDSCYHGRHW